ncbi:RNA polymerase II transcription factor SIII subunit A-domain-containing protein [Ganoderma leucocontextum]|nr:RNA polymerase II transcription factor SIII subunit A-domain-containing protein [Ganoderma leucocontextum]
MSYDIEPGGRRIPTLVQCCQRVACANVESICSLGEGWRSDLIRPVLEGCTPETLQRFEDADPYIAEDTEDIWKRLFLKEFPIEAHQYESNAMEEPESWRDELFALRDRERAKLNALSNRLKASRQEEEERKRESAIKLTDKVPPAKRSRPWGAPSQPKTLFQKTKSEAWRLNKGVFGSRITRPAFQTHRIVPNTASAKPPPPSRAAPSMKGANSSQPSGSRVVVRSVPVVQKPEPAPSKQVPLSQTKSASATPIAAYDVLSMPAPHPPSKASTPPPCSPPETIWSPLPQPQTLSPEARSLSARTPGKKNPGASLFMPKHRAYSQLPHGVQSKS